MLGVEPLDGEVEGERDMPLVDHGPKVADVLSPAGSRSQ